MRKPGWWCFAEFLLLRLPQEITVAATGASSGAARRAKRQDLRAGLSQLQGNPEFYRFVAEQVGASPDLIPPMENIDEDCLYLNVWTRNLGRGDKRPVMVWIYGGGNSNGYAQEPEYLGEQVCQPRRGLRFIQLPCWRPGVPGAQRPVR